MEDIFSKEEKTKVIHRTIYYPESTYNDFNKLCQIASKPLNKVLIHLVELFIEENKEKLKTKTKK